MAYITVEDLRSGALYPYLRIPASGNGGVDDSRLGLIIGAAERVVDTYTRDHFEATDITQRCLGTGLTDILYVPKRIRSVSSVTAYDFAGVATDVPDDYYLVYSSFDIFDTNLVGNQGRDGLKMRQDLSGITWLGETPSPSCFWAEPPAYYDVAGTFDHAQTPDEVKQATALIVWSWTTSEIPPGVDQVDSATFRMTKLGGNTDSTGVRDADALLSDLRRFQVGEFGVAI